MLNHQFQLSREVIGKIMSVMLGMLDMLCMLSMFGMLIMYHTTRTMILCTFPISISLFFLLLCWHMKASILNDSRIATKQILSWRFFNVSHIKYFWILLIDHVLIIFVYLLNLVDIFKNHFSIHYCWYSLL